MKKRPKLDLVGGRDTGKKQPTGFDMDAEVAAGTPRSPQQQAERLAEGTAGTPGNAPLRQSGGSGAGKVVKALLVVAATALSLYLLKRRFF